MATSARSWTRLGLASKSTACRTSLIRNQCQQRAVSRSQNLISPTRVCLQQRQASTSRPKVPYTEKIRKKIWGTEDTPGQMDPYGNQSLFDQTDNPKEDLSEANDTPTISPELAKQNYIPATSWDGLDRIGGASGWWEEAWDAEHQFEGFMAREKVDSREKIEGIVRTAVEEVLHPKPPSLKPGPIVSGTQDKPVEAQNSAKEMGAVGEEEQSSFQSNDSRWLKTSFENLDIKFSVFKRVMQLSGARIPDSNISNIRTARDLVEHLVLKPKPKKLVDSLLANDKLTSLPNVQIFERRYTPIDKDKEVGRWKIIERELKRKGLPVTGKV